MEQFVRVRVVQGNALYLSLFQFDTDVVVTDRLGGLPVVFGPDEWAPMLAAA